MIAPQLTSRIDPDTDRKLAEVAQQLSLAIAKNAPGQHVVLDTTGQLLIEGVLVNNNGVPEVAPDSVGQAIEAFNEKLTEYRQRLRDSGGDVSAAAWTVEVALEPSLHRTQPAMVAASSSESMALSVVQEIPPTLDQDAGTEGDVVYIGPVQLLNSGLQDSLQAKVLATHRAMSARTMSTPMSRGQLLDDLVSPGASGPAALTLQGRTQHEAWLVVPHSLFPQDVGATRCLAQVNAQLFALRRMCACLNGCPGGGTANIAQQLMIVLEVVHAKSKAALALKASRNLMDVASGARAAGEEASVVGRMLHHVTMRQRLSSAAVAISALCEL
jgi:hypothetical protein